MNKSILILKREYITRVKKKSFIVMTLLVPVLMAAMTVLPAYLATMDDSNERTIAVYDPTALVLNKIENTEYTRFHYIPEEVYNELSANFQSDKFYALLYIPPNILTTNQAQLISDKQVTFDIKNLIQERIEKLIENDKRQQVISESGIPDLEKKLQATHTKIKLSTIKIGEKGEAVKSSTEIAMVVGYAAGFIIYMFVFIYGAMVMRGIMEEKSSRIVEVIISSVKPFQLMFGKIVGIGLVGLTQIAIWVILGTAITFGIQAHLSPDSTEVIAQSNNIMSNEVMVSAGQQAANSNVVADVIESIQNLNLPLLLLSFLFYFIGGFLMYSSLMGAVGSAVDSEEEVQQLMLPVTIPLIFSIIILFSVIKNPEGPLAFWTSIIPLTSPVIMMVRIPFGVPAWQLLLSMGILIATIFGTIWIAAKIYRTGILMYGKKVNFKELIKWLTYKN